MGVSKVEIKNADGTKNVLVDLTGDTVTADMLAKGITAHGADGENINGVIEEIKSNSTLAGSKSFADSSGVVIKTSTDVSTGEKSLVTEYNAKKDALIRKGCSLTAYVAFDKFGDAVASDVAKGKTFTSITGLKVKGTAEAIVSNDNCEAYHITDKSTALNFKRTDGDIKVWGYGFKSSGMYQKTTYAFCGDGYYAGSLYMNPTKTSVTWSFNTDGTLSGLPGGLTALDVLVTKGI